MFQKTSFHTLTSLKLVMKLIQSSATSVACAFEEFQLSDNFISKLISFIARIIKFYQHHSRNYPDKIVKKHKAYV